MEWSEPATHGWFYVPPMHNLEGTSTPLGDQDPHFLGHSMDSGTQHVITSGDTALGFNSLEQLHIWLDDLKASVPKPPPGPGASAEDIDAFLNA